MAKTGLKKNTISFFIILAIVIVLGVIYYYLDKAPPRESIINYNACTANDPKSNRICSNGQYMTCPGGFFPSPLGSHVCVTKETTTTTSVAKCPVNYIRVPNTTTCRELVPPNKVPPGWTLSEGKASIK
jgi:hypothetical protein